MRRYKLVHILVILSVFNFVPVLAAPVPAQGVREVCADMADGGEDVVIVSGKRALQEGQVPESQGLAQGSGGSWYYEWTPGSQDSGSWHHVWSQSPGSMSVQSSTSPQHPPSPSASDDASQLPSGEMRRPPYASGGTELPWYSSGMQRPSSASGGTILPSYRPDSGGVQQVQPETANKLQPASSVRTKTYPWVAATKIEPASSSSGGGGVQQVQPGTTSKFLPSSSARTKTYPFVSTTEIGPATPTPSESSDEITPAPSSNVVPPKQPTPQPKNVLNKLTSKSKSLFRKLGRITKSLFSEMVDNPHLQIRISATTSGAVNAAQRELLGTAHTEAYVSALPKLQKL
jgi:hypothetical protein